MKGRDACNWENLTWYFAFAASVAQRLVSLPVVGEGRMSGSYAVPTRRWDGLDGPVNPRAYQNPHRKLSVMGRPVVIR